MTATAQHRTGHATALEAAEGRRALGPAWAKRAAGLHVVKLRGSAYEMGRQHGALLRDAIPRGPLAYYRTYVEKVFGRLGLGPLAPVVRRALYTFVGQRIARRFPARVAESIRGLADGAGMTYREALEACVMPDTLLWIASRAIKLSGAPPAVRHRLALRLGCTSAIAWGSATKDGKLLHGRNLDYHGVASWPREQAVIFHEPDDGLRYVSISSAGILMGGVTAMNEAGLTLTVHQHMFTGEAALGGTPIGAIGDEVMRRATSLDEAEAILAGNRPIGCWTHIVADGPRRETLVFEDNPTRRASFRFGGGRPGPETLPYTNIYLDPELGRTEADWYGSYWRHNQGRYERAKEVLEARAGTIDGDAIAAILADDGACDCRISRAISMLMTVASVVFAPEDGVVWVAAGEAPTSNRPFEPFSLAKEDHAPEHGRLTGGLPADREAHEAFECYRDAYLADFDEGRPDEARRLIDRARALRPKETLYHVLAGLLAIREGDARAAAAAFDRAIELGHRDPERVATAHLWRGRARDLLGERVLAVKDYEAALACERRDHAVEAAARRGLKKAYTGAEARKVAIDFAFADVVRP